MTTSVATYANANIESMGVNNVTPLDMILAKEELIAAMQSNFTRPLLNPIKPMKEVVAGDPIMSTIADELSSFASRRELAEAIWQQKQMLYRNFGRFLPDDEKKIVNAAKSGLEGIEDRLAAVVYAIDKIKSRKAWKLEQRRAQLTKNYGPHVTAKKVIIDGKKQWDDALIHELPPFSHNNAHEPAYYAIKLPDGTVVNLGQSVEGFSAKKNQYPSQAMQNIAKRLGVDMRGGDTAILNHLLKTEQIEITDEHGVTTSHYQWLPSYTSAWQGVWIVYVGWRRNPVCTASRYWLDANDELTQQPQSDIAPLTLSQLDYKLLCESSDLAVTDENDEVVEFMNEEEEFLTMFPQRETDETFIDFSKYCDDDEEMELFQACSAVIDRSEGGITLGDLESSQFVNEYLHKGILRAEKTIHKMESQNPSPGLDIVIANMEEHLGRLNRLDAQWNHFVGNSKTDHLVTYWYPNVKHRMMCMSSLEHAKMIPKVITNAHIMPDNEIERPKVLNHASRPWLARSFQMTLGQSKAIRRQKLVLQAMLHGRFGMLIREKNAQATFENAFEGALRA